jgi:hypothetical protein
MIDITSTIRESLRARAEPPVRADGLHDRVLARSRQIRRRRRAFATSAGVGLVAAMTVGALAAPGLLPGAWFRGPGGSDGFTGSGVTVAAGSMTATPDGAAAPDTGRPTTLPELTGVPPAADRPAAVGSDPGILHFDVDLTGLDAAESEWASGIGYESVEITPRSKAPSRAPSKAGSTAGSPGPWYGGSPTQIYVGPDRDRLYAVKDDPAGIATLDHAGRVTARPGTLAMDPPQPVTINGRAGRIAKARTVPASGGSAQTWPTDRADGADGGWVLEWQPVDGLFAVAQVHGDDRPRVLAAAAALRPNRAQRCATPVRLADPPRGATWTACSTRIRTVATDGRGVWVNSRIVIGQADGGRLDVYLEEQSDRTGFRPTRTVAGHPATWLRSDPRGLWVINFGPAEVFVSGASENDPRLSVDEAVALLRSATMTRDLSGPRTWPARAVG